MNLGVLAWIAETPLGAWPYSSPYIWPTLECVHFVSLCVLFGSLLVIDLRLIGFFRQPCQRVVGTLIRFSLAAFSVNLLTGILFFAGNTPKYVDNPALELKLMLVLAAGINALYFRMRLRHIVESQEVSPGSVVVGALSLLLWSGVIVCGRMITFYAP